MLLDMLPHLHRQGLFSKPKLIGLLQVYPESSCIDSTELTDSFVWHPLYQKAEGWSGYPNQPSDCKPYAKAYRLFSTRPWR